MRDDLPGGKPEALRVPDTPPTVNSASPGSDNPRVSTSRARVVTAEQWGKPERNEAGDPICRWCRAPVIAPRRTTDVDPTFPGRFYDL